MKKTVFRIATGVAAVALSFGAAAGTAAAATPSSNLDTSTQLMAKVVPMAWNGNCYAISYTNTSFTGWCDGTGPQTYGTYVDCSDGFRYGSSYVHWYGDRRGVTSYCPGGTVRVSQGYEIF